MPDNAQTKPPLVSADAPPTVPRAAPDAGQDEEDTPPAVEPAVQLAQLMADHAQAHHFTPPTAPAVAANGCFSLSVNEIPVWLSCPWEAPCLLLQAKVTTLPRDAAARPRLLEALLRLNTQLPDGDRLCVAGPEGAVVLQRTIDLDPLDPSALDDELGDLADSVQNCLAVAGHGE